MMLGLTKTCILLLLLCEGSEGLRARKVLAQKKISDSAWRGNNKPQNYSSDGNELNEKENKMSASAKPSSKTSISTMGSTGSSSSVTTTRGSRKSTGNGNTDSMTASAGGQIKAREQSKTGDQKSSSMNKKKSYEKGVKRSERLKKHNDNEGPGTIFLVRSDQH